MSVNKLAADILSHKSPFDSGIDEDLLKRMEDQNFKLQEISDSVIKNAPFPKNIMNNPTTPIDVMNSAVGHPSYIAFWRTIEREVNYSERIKLHAFLHCVKDLTLNETELSMSPSEYYNKSFKNIRNKIEEWIEVSELTDTTLSAFVNKLEL